MGDEKKYGSLEELRASDEYQDAGVLGRERLVVKHFPDTIPPSNAEGRNPGLPAQEQPMATRRSAPSTGNELGSK
jgi:hypothetical protein